MTLLQMALKTLEILVLLSQVTTVCTKYSFCCVLYLSFLVMNMWVPIMQFSCFFLSTRTRSGFEPSPTDTRMSAGMVPPLILKFCRSANTSVLFVVNVLIVVVKYWSTLSCLQVNLPWFSATVHILVIWARVAFGDEHKGQIPILRFPHLASLVLMIVTHWFADWKLMVLYHLSSHHLYWDTS